MIMCFYPCVPYSYSVFSPISEEGPDNMSIFVFGGLPEYWRALYNAGYSI